MPDWLAHWWFYSLCVGGFTFPYCGYLTWKLIKTNKRLDRIGAPK